MLAFLMACVVVFVDAVKLKGMENYNHGCLDIVTL